MPDILIEWIHQSKEAAEQARQWLTHAEAPGEEALYVHIRRYAAAKLLLPENFPTDSIAEMAQESLARLLAIPRDKLHEIDMPAGCSGATAVSDKKALLLLSLSNILQVPITIDTALEMHTLREVTAYFFNHKWGGV